MLISDRALKFQALWKATTRVPPPESEQFMRWCIRFDDGLIERAIMKCAAKFNRSQADPERAHRYVTKLLQNLADDQKGHMKTSTPTLASEKAEQLLSAVRDSKPNPTRELAEHLLKSGEVHVDSTIGDLGTAVRRYYAQQ